MVMRAPAYVCEFSSHKVLQFTYITPVDNDYDEATLLSLCRTLMGRAVAASQCGGPTRVNAAEDAPLNAVENGNGKNLLAKSVAG